MMIVPPLPHDRSKVIKRRHVVDVALQWILDGRAGAVVRFGEGEGRLLVADPADDESMRVAIRKVRRQTGMVISHAEVLELKSHVLRAFDEADIVGIHGSRSFNDEHKMWVARVEEEFAKREAQGRRPAFTCHCLVSNDLRDALQQLLDAAPATSVITCRNLVPVLQEHYNAEDVVLYQVPSQYIMRNVDGDFESKLHGVPIWPQFYEDLVTRIEVRTPGELFLVGAGLFAKELCVIIRERGGIALDMGSVLDKLADKTTRGPNRPEPYTP